MNYQNISGGSGCVSFDLAACAKYLWADELIKMPRKWIVTKKRPLGAFFIEFENCVPASTGIVSIVLSWRHLSRIFSLSKLRTSSRCANLFRISDIDSISLSATFPISLKQYAILAWCPSRNAPVLSAVPNNPSAMSSHNGSCDLIASRSFHSRYADPSTARPRWVWSFNSWITFLCSSSPGKVNSLSMVSRGSELSFFSTCPSDSSDTSIGRLSRGLALQRPYTPPKGAGWRCKSSILRPSDRHSCRRLADVTSTSRAHLPASVASSSSFSSRVSLTESIT